jgi:hypothetical protein
MKKITIITSFFRADKYIDHYLKNIRNIVGYRILCVHHVYNILGSHVNNNNVNRKLQEFSKEYRNFNLFNIEKDPGLYSLWNRSCKTSNTPYLMTLNIDDMCEPKYVISALYEINKYKGDLISSPIKVTKNKNTHFDDYYTLWYNTKKIYFDKRFDKMKQLKKANIIKNKKGEYYEINCNRQYKQITKNIKPMNKKSVMVQYKSYSLEDMFIDWNNDNNYISYCMPHCTPIWKRELHQTYGYFNEEKYGVYADFEFWLRLLKKDRKFIQMSKPMVLYLEDEKSHNRRDINRKQYMEQIKKKYT